MINLITFCNYYFYVNILFFLDYKITLNLFININYLAEKKIYMQSFLIKEVIFNWKSLRIIFQWILIYAIFINNIIRFNYYYILLSNIVLI